MFSFLTYLISSRTKKKGRRCGRLVFWKRIQRLYGSRLRNWRRWVSKSKFMYLHLEQWIRKWSLEEKNKYLHSWTFCSMHMSCYLLFCSRCDEMVHLVCIKISLFLLLFIISIYLCPLCFIPNIVRIQISCDFDSCSWLIIFLFWCFLYGPIVETVVYLRHHRY